MANPTNNPTTMVAYVRVSSDGQARSGLGMKAQRAAIAAAAQREGWQIIDWATDNGESAKTTDRPGFHRALDLVADGSADGLVAAKLDRVCRSVIDFASLLAWFTNGSKSLVVLDPAIDTTTASGRLVANVFAAVAEWERDVIADRTSAALQAKRASGLAICRPSVADDPKLTKRIRAMADDGLSLHDIARELSAKGVPTVRGGSQWRASSVQAALGYKRPKTHRAADLPVIKRQRRKAG